MAGVLLITPKLEDSLGGATRRLPGRSRFRLLLTHLLIYPFTHLLIYSSTHLHGLRLELIIFLAFWICDAAVIHRTEAFDEAILDQPQLAHG